MKITPEYLQQIIQEETNILLFEKRLGRELTTEEIEKLHELFGVRSLSDKKAGAAWEKELEKIRAGESDEERQAADIRQAQLDIPIDRNPKSEKPTQQPAQVGADRPEVPQLSPVYQLLTSITKEDGKRAKSRVAMRQTFQQLLKYKMADDARDMLKRAVKFTKTGNTPSKLDLDLILKSITRAGKQRYHAFGMVSDLLYTLQKDVDPRQNKDTKEFALQKVRLYQRTRKALAAEDKKVGKATKGNLKELLLPLITQVLKEATK